jgi:hypothetical protein
MVFQPVVTNNSKKVLLMVLRYCYSSTVTRYPSTRSYFSTQEQSMHINALELLGCWYTISALLPLAVQWSEVHLSCELDSIVAIK